MEYERRVSSPSMCVFSVTNWPCVKRNASRKAGGTSKETVTASAVSGRTSRMRSEWNCGVAMLSGLGVVRSVRFEVVERLATVDAAIQRLARGRAELRETFRV